MADKKISQLTAASTPLAGTEVLPIVQSGSTVKVASNDLTVKNVRSNATTGILQVVGPGASTTRVMTTPDANFTVARTDAAQTFSGTQTFAGNFFYQGTTFSVSPSAADALVYVQAPTANQGSILWTEQGVRVNGALGFPAGSDVLTYRAGSLNAGSGGTPVFAAGPTGNFTLNSGNLVVGTAGKGIDFSVNGGDVLTQYNQGTWTPADASGAGLTFTNNGAAFTQIGNVVTINMEIVWPVTADGSAAKVTLPFAPAAGTRAAVGAMSNAGVVNFYIPGSINAALYNNAGATISNATMSGKYLMVSISYLL